MKFLTSNKIQTLFFFIAVLCLGSVSIAENSNFNIASFKVLKDNHQLNKKNNLASTQLSTFYQASNALEFEDDNFDDDDAHDACARFAINKASYNTSSVLENSSSRKIGFTKIPFYILFCSLKLPFIV